METQNIVMRLVYTDKPSAAVMMILKTILCVVAAAFILAAVYLSPKQPKLNNKITWRFVHWVTAGPFDYCGHGSFALGGLWAQGIWRQTGRPDRVRTWNRSVFCIFCLGAFFAAWQQIPSTV